MRACSSVGKERSGGRAASQKSAKAEKKKRNKKSQKTDISEFLNLFVFVKGARRGQEFLRVTSLAERHCRSGWSGCRTI